MTTIQVTTGNFTTARRYDEKTKTFLSPFNPGREDAYGEDGLKKIPELLGEGFQAAKGVIDVYTLADVQDMAKAMLADKKGKRPLDLQGLPMSKEMVEMVEQYAKDPVKAAIADQKSIAEYYRQCDEESEKPGKIDYTREQWPAETGADAKASNTVRTLTFADLATLHDERAKSWEKSPKLLDYLALNGQRRRFFGEAVAWYSDKLRPNKPDGEGYHWAIEVVPFIDLEATLRSVIDANKRYAQDYSPIAKLGHVWGILNRAAPTERITDARVMELTGYKKGETMKLLGVAKLAKAHRAENIVERCSLERESKSGNWWISSGQSGKLVYQPKGYIPLESIDAADMAVLNGAKKPSSKKINPAVAAAMGYADGLITEERKGVKATREQVQAYFKNLIEMGSTRIARLKASEIETILGDSNIEVWRPVHEVLKMVIASDSTKAIKYFGSLDSSDDWATDVVNEAMALNGERYDVDKHEFIVVEDEKETLPEPPAEIEVDE